MIECSMRRKEKEIIDAAEIDRVIMEAEVCRLGFASGGEPYIVPMNFGYDHGNRRLYFHSAKEGRKIDALRLESRVCFEIDTRHAVVAAESACAWSARFVSIIGWGRIAFVEDREEKIRGLDCIMSHYSGKSGWSFEDRALERVFVLRLEIEKMTGKKSGLDAPDLPAPTA
jgi:uncharacterized protein